jgi:hypothetical protein
MTLRTLRPAALVRTAERVSTLQLVDEFLDWLVGLSLGETCSYRFEVLLQACGEAPLAREGLLLAGKEGLLEASEGLLQAGEQAVDGRQALPVER